MYINVLNHCVGCGACAKLSPEVFDISNDAATVNLHRVQGNESSCIEAAMVCPVGAINLHEY